MSGPRPHASPRRSAHPQRTPWQQVVPCACASCTSQRPWPVVGQRSRLFAEKRVRSRSASRVHNGVQGRCHAAVVLCPECAVRPPVRGPCAQRVCAGRQEPIQHGGRVPVLQPGLRWCVCVRVHAVRAPEGSRAPAAPRPIFCAVVGQCSCQWARVGRVAIALGATRLPQLAVGVRTVHVHAAVALARTLTRLCAPPATPTPPASAPQVP